MNIRCFLFKKSQNHFCVPTLIARRATTFAKVLIACRATTFSKAYFLTSYLLPKNRPCGSHPPLFPLFPLLPLLPSSPVRLAPHYFLSPLPYCLLPIPSYLTQPLEPPWSNLGATLSPIAYPLSPTPSPLKNPNLHIC